MRHCDVVLDISLGNHPSEPGFPLLPGRRRSTDVLQCEEYLSVSQRLPAAATRPAHVVMVMIISYTQLHTHTPGGMARLSWPEWMSDLETVACLSTNPAPCIRVTTGTLM